MTDPSILYCQCFSQEFINVIRCLIPKYGIFTRYSALSKILMYNCVHICPLRCDKMIDVLSPTPQNDLSEGSKRTRTVQFTYDSNNLNSEKHCRRQGRGCAGGGGGANGEMANLTNGKGKFAIAIFRHFSPLFAIFRHW